MRLCNIVEISRYLFIKLPLNTFSLNDYKLCSALGAGRRSLYIYIFFSIVYIIYIFLLYGPALLGTRFGSCYKFNLKLRKHILDASKVGLFTRKWI